MKSIVLVLVQFVSLLYFFATGGMFTDNHILFGVQLIGLFVGLWAINIMGPFRVRVFPEPRTDAELIEEGPYKLIRHPMYAAIILVCLPVVLERMDLWSTVVFAGLVLNLILKMNHEEALLLDHYASYESYMTRTKRIIPFVY